MCALNVRHMQDTFLKLNTPMRVENSPLCVRKNNNPTTGRFLRQSDALKGAVQVWTTYQAHISGTRIGRTCAAHT